MHPTIHRIAVVIPKYGLIGGAEQFVAELTERVALNRHYEMHVFANKWTVHSEHVTFHKVPAITFPKFLTTPSFAWFAGRMIARVGFDLVHAHDRIFEADIFTMHGIPHRLWAQEIRKKRMNLYDYATDWVERALVGNKKCRLFLAVSSLTKEKFLQVYTTTNPESVQIMHPGVELERFQKLDRPSCRRQIRESYGIGPDEIVFLFVSMNFEIKGLDKLMAALAIVKTGNPGQKFTLLVVGKGDVRRYAELAGKLGLADRVVFAGIMDKEKLDKTYLASDIFSILSKFDTFGMVVLEAMAASLPVIVSDRVGAKDMLTEGVNGCIIDEEDDPVKISEKISPFLDRKKSFLMGQEAYRKARDCTWEQAARRLESIYEEMVAGKLRPHGGQDKFAGEM